MTVSMERIEMKIVPWPPSNQGEETLVVKVNPFQNLLEMITFYHGVAERNDPDELDAFLDNEFSKNKDKYPKLVNAEDINDFIIHSLLDSLSGDNSQTKNESWMDFDADALEEVLRNPFFEEYNKKIMHRGDHFKEGELLCEKDGVKVYDRGAGLYTRPREDYLIPKRLRAAGTLYLCEAAGTGGVCTFR